MDDLIVLTIHVSLIQSSCVTIIRALLLVELLPPHSLPIFATRLNSAALCRVVKTSANWWCLLSSLYLWLWSAATSWLTGANNIDKWQAVYWHWFEIAPIFQKLQNAAERSTTIDLLLFTFWQIHPIRIIFGGTHHKVDFNHTLHWILGKNISKTLSHTKIFQFHEKSVHFWA